VINWGKDKIQVTYAKDTGVRELKEKKKNNDNIQERKSILY